MRFSLRRLLAGTALVAVTLYVLLVRPTVVAKKYAHEMRSAAQTNFKSVSVQYFENMRTDKATLQVGLSPRTWGDVLRCKQDFQVALVRPTDKKSQWLISRRYFYATPFGVKDQGGPILVLKTAY